MPIKKIKTVDEKFRPRRKSPYSELYASVEKGKAFTMFECDTVREAKRFANAARTKGFDVQREDTRVFLRIAVEQKAAS